MKKKTIIAKNKKRKLADNHLYNKKKIRDSLNINIKMNSSDLLLKKTNGKEISKENEEGNIIKNKYASEKDNIKYNENNLEKETFSKIFILKTVKIMKKVKKMKILKKAKI